MLGTPPAFILSQDQTRHPVINNPPLTERMSMSVELRSRPSYVVFAWLVRRFALPSLGREEKNFVVTGTCVIDTCCCSAFHSSIVKVIPQTKISVCFVVTFIRDRYRNQRSFPRKRSRSLWVRILQGKKPARGSIG